MTLLAGVFLLYIKYVHSNYIDFNLKINMKDTDYFGFLLSFHKFVYSNIGGQKLFSYRLYIEAERKMVYNMY